MTLSDLMLQVRAEAQAGRRLDRALAAAPVLPFDDRSRLIFFSDLHRGDNTPADAFRCNRDLFIGALRHYEREGYTYVEVGDGDELWKNKSLEAVHAAHRPVFRIMERLRRRGRLQLLIGNHQLLPRRGRNVWRGGPLLEALVLQYRNRPLRILVTHGHQADATHVRPYGLIRPVVRHLVRHLQRWGLSTWLPEKAAAHSVSPLAGAIALAHSNQAGIERRIQAWLERTAGLAIICGHTHRPAFAAAGGPLYFNTGSGIQPGTITGLEIANGAISLVAWSDRRPEGPGAASMPHLPRRTVLAGPEPLSSL
ncbi:MAG: hypothetical protein ACOX2L_10960 [Anaerolineae bacterium]|jgi:UDP-2,3-diacylglucosamine pyrophosphatase LpxH|nr:hypothetical protein [Chloroflexota bacterium]